MGVDVPDSSICIIDRAANFGLSQLHQIRGRIGRGEKPLGEQLDECFCVLLFDDKPRADGEDNNTNIGRLNSGAEDTDNTDNALQYTPLPPPKKLTILADSSDGFVIAEQDLLMRGPGDFFGFDQSGFFIFYFHISFVFSFVSIFHEYDNSRN